MYMYLYKYIYIYICFEYFWRSQPGFNTETQQTQVI